MSRTLGSLCCLVPLCLAVPASLGAATHPAPGVGLNVTTHALRAGDHAPYVDPNGARALPGGDLGPYIDPDG